MMENERLIIRPFTHDDAHDVYECCNDYEVVKTTLGMPWPYTEDMARGWINNQKARAKEGISYELAICFKDNPNKIIGCVSRKKFRIAIDKQIYICYNSPALFL